jgi:hypothetical protein
MPINFSLDGSLGIRRPPRVINVQDTYGACPGAGRPNPLMSLTFTTAQQAVVVIEGEIIRSRDGNNRCDLELRGPGWPHVDSDSYTTSNARLDYTLDSDDGFHVTEWDNHCFRWMGYVNAGTSTFSVNYASCANSWGCGTPWGQINAIIFE